MPAKISFGLKSESIFRWRRFGRSEGTDFAAVTWTLPGFDRRNP
ncbi:hypothetical protein ACE1CI_31155 [Aerosakkonemataceae cyanobacterium BLCC-F50]|uniref:Uncharacterized protein n=1 Tax=Floridaenema flaviceps BLCC-F50 TaxID=3153642 RepID=A0ABV4Y073_9CYAN